MKKILITGAAGFIGTNLIKDLLDNGYDSDCIVGIDNMSHGEYIEEVHDNIVLFQDLDIRDRDAVFKLDEHMPHFKPDVIFHFAGLVSIYDCNLNPMDAVTNNIVGSMNIFDYTLKHDSKLIFSETSAVYENVKLPESGYVETESDPTTIYSTTKSAVALLAESYKRTKGLKYTALRYFNVAGHLQDYFRTVPPLFAGVLIRYMINKKPIVFGDGNRRRDFIHVDDVNKFHQLCIDSEDVIGETYNLGTGKSTSIFEIIEIISKKLNKDFEYIQMPEINGEAFEIFANIDKAKSLGWFPEKTIKDAIDDTYEFLKGRNLPINYMDDINVEEVKIKK